MVGVTRVGGDVQVNTDSNDYPFGNAPSIVKMAGGGYMVLWSESNNNRGGSGSGDIRAEIFNAAGTKVGSEFIVNTTLTGQQASASATLLPDGTIFVTWQDSSLTGGDASSNSIKGQLLSATGTTVGSEFLVNTTTSGAQSGPQISALNNGNVIITWSDQSQTGGDTSNSAVRAQIMTATGTKVGGEFLVNTTTSGSQAGARIASLSGGNVIVTWTDASGQGADADGNSIKGQLLDSSGAKVGTEFLVNTNTAGNQTSSNVTALANGGFVVTWQDTSGTLGDASTSVKAQIFDAAGVKVGTEFLVNTLTDGPQLAPNIATLDNGDFVITWQDQLFGAAPGRQDLRGQLFSPTGVKIGPDFVADAPFINSVEGAPGILAIGDGKFVIASSSSLFTETGQGTVLTTRGEHLQVFAGSRELNGTVGADQLVAAAGGDVIYASPGHDTIDGRGGTDRVIVNADDRSLFALTTGSVTYTLAGGVLSNGLGTLDTTLTSVEQVEIFDRSSANHTYNDAVGGTRFFHFGSGDDVINTGGTIQADLGFGNNRIDGLVGGHDFVTLFVDSSTSPVTVTDSSGGITISYATTAGQSSTQITNVEAYNLQAVDGQGLRVDTSNSLANISLTDSPFDDMLIGGRGDNIFVSFSSANQADLSTGTDYKFGNGGADTYDYSVAMPTTAGDHIMDLDSDDILDFSYYQANTNIRLGPNPSFIGTAAFTGVERQIRYEKVDGKTYIYTDVNGDGTADGTVVIENGAFDLALTANASGGETVLKITLAQNFVNGTTAGESLFGAPGADVVRAYAGDDTIRASTGQDFVDGGTGFDVLNVTMGDPSIFTAPTAARSYTIGSDRITDSSGVLNTSFLGIESISLSTVGAGNFGDTIDAHAFRGTLNLTLGAGQDIVIGTAQNDSINGGGGSDTLSGGLGVDVLTGGGGIDSFTGTTAGLNGDTITDLAVGEKITITDANLAGFTYSLSGAALTYTGGTVTLSNLPTGAHLVATAHAGGGVDLMLMQAAVGNDFNADGRSDILFRSAAGGYASWQLSGASSIGGGGNLGNPGSAYRLAGVGDFDGDGKTDLMFRGRDGTLASWQMSGTSIVGGGNIGNPGAAYALVGTGDFNGDGKSDALFLNALTGGYASWDLNGTAIIGGGNIGNPGAGYVYKATGDFNGDGKSDVLFQNANGTYASWTLNDTTITGGGNIGNPGADWFFKGVGDFNGDGKTDMLFENSDGTYASWDLNGTAIIGGGNIGNPGAAWSLVGIGDYNGDGKSDLLFRNANGTEATWTLNDTAITGGGTLGNPGSSYGVASGHGANGFATLVFQNADGSVATWQVNGGANVGGGTLGNPGDAWTAKAVGDFVGTGESDVLFQHSDGTLATWHSDGSHLIGGGGTIGNAGPAYAYRGIGDFNGDGKSDILFQNTTTGTYASWDVAGNAIIGGGNIGVAAGFSFVATGDMNGDGKADILFRDAAGNYASWFLDDTAIIGGGNIGNPGAGWDFKGLADLNGDGKADMLFQNSTTGIYASWDLDGASIVGGGNIGNPGGSYNLAKLFDINGDGKADLVFQDATGHYAAWLMDDTHILQGATIGTAATEWHMVSSQVSNDWAASSSDAAFTATGAIIAHGEWQVVSEPMLPIHQQIDTMLI